MSITPPNNSMQRTALRAAADAGRQAYEESTSDDKRRIDWRLVLSMVIGATIGCVFGGFFGGEWGVRVLWAAVGLACGVAIRKGSKHGMGKDDS